MSNFTVWYILAVFYVDTDGIHSAMSPKVDLPTCQRDAQRVMATFPKGDAKWRCHEMTIDVKGMNVAVNFPEN